MMIQTFLGWKEMLNIIQCWNIKFYKRLKDSIPVARTKMKDNIIFRDTSPVACVSCTLISSIVPQHAIIMRCVPTVLGTSYRWWFFVEGLFMGNWLDNWGWLYRKVVILVCHLYTFFQWKLHKVRRVSSSCCCSYLRKLSTG